MRWFSLNREGQSQLNNEVMKRNVLDEAKPPQEEPREIPVVKSSHIHRDVSTYDFIHALNLRDTKRSLANVSSLHF